MKKQIKICHLFRKDTWERNNFIPFRKLRACMLKVELKELLKQLVKRKIKLCFALTFPLTNVWGNKKWKYNKREDLEKGWVNGAPDQQVCSSTMEGIGGRVEKKQRLA